MADKPDGAAQSTLQNLLKQLALLVQAMQRAYPPQTVGAVTLAAAATTTVVQAAVTANSRIALWPTNAAAATLVGSTRSPYVSSKAAGTNFVISTASGVAAAGTETFQYVVTS